jgi:RES domain-containing protein
LATIVAFRASNWDVPFWAGSARREYRYSRIGSEATQYWSLHPLGPLAETLRWRNVKAPEFVAELRTRLWGAEFSDDSILRVTFDSAEEHGISPEDLVAEDYEACQQWADGIRDRVQGVTVPSAALPGTDNLVLFGPRVRIPYGTTPVNAQVEGPSDPTAEAGQPPSDLLRYVRWRGDSHPGLDAWRRGELLGPPILRLDRS